MSRTASSRALRASPEETARLMRLATYASVSVATVLILSKLIAWYLSGSVSLLATLVDSVLDSMASLLNLLAVRTALSPADKQHRFGHGKAEALAGLGQALLIVGSALFLIVESVRRLADPVPISAVPAGVFVMLLSLGLTFALLTFQGHVVRRTDSTAIKADALHYRTDLLVNFSVLLALVLSGWAWAGFDSLIALGIALYILHSAWQIILQAFDHLLDRELPEEDRENIRALVMAHGEVRGLHDLRSRQSGTDTFLQLHLELDDELNLLQGHRISDEVEASLRAAYPEAEIIIHIDPLSVVGLEPRKTFPG